MPYSNNPTIYCDNITIYCNDQPGPVEPPVNEPPEVSFELPTTYIVPRRFKVTVIADDTDLKVIRLFLDGKLIKKSSKSPLSTIVRLRKNDKSEHTLRAVAVDEAGNKTIKIHKVIAN